jgi:hypothetical protein
MLQLAVAVSPRLLFFWEGSIDVAAMKFAAITASASPLNPIERQETTGEARNAVREWCSNWRMMFCGHRSVCSLWQKPMRPRLPTIQISSYFIIFDFPGKRMCGRSRE